jgi:N-acetyl-anhydromuramyl-L-alanine amidase AmpD
MRTISAIIIHCSDTDIESHDNVEVIRRWHLGRGWSDIGYHYFIQQSGNLQFGRPLRKVGAHVKGHNRHTVGICLSGRNKFSEAQFTTLKKIIRNLLDILDLKKENVFAHNHFDYNKTCPNFDVQEILKDL